MKHISRFYFSLFLVLLSFTGNAQEEINFKPAKGTAGKSVEKTDSIPVKKERYGLRVGVDLFKLTKSFYETDYRGLELVGDYRLTRRYYLAGEIGNEDKTVDDDMLNFTTKGSYLKVGFDYNTYENWLNMENIISVGLRYGVSSFTQTLNSYTVYNPNPYFGQAQEIPSGEEFKGLSAQWIEVVAGMKTEVFNNIFVGFSVRLNRLVSQKLPNNFDNLYIPGFNRTYNGDFGVGFNYTVSYFIPLYKSTVKAKEKAEKKKK
ncbi:DUF6048 family protein [Flavobacterium wongokense]|uniref:DUF6048 family protein n=1 Tax=Flavobacterium wongokense TaxID=2910674 RepID=UPI001F3A0ECE|nr:DUF6048 family protein [Flavobacterium sp. WG47]MCF6131997.1 DUF6048 family protein [Flavobacterium sp. WG47]